MIYWKDLQTLNEESNKVDETKKLLQNNNCEIRSTVRRNSRQ